MKVLVTGATGFIGARAMAGLRAAGIAAVGAARRPPPDDRGWQTVDLLRPGEAAALIDRVAPTHLLHLAWNATPGRFWTALDNLDWTAASLNLLRAFWTAGGTRAVIAGSVAEYDWSEARLTENGPIAPATLYGVAKDALRRTVMAAAAESGQSVAWGRVFWLYGPGEQPNRLVSDVVAGLAAGRPVDCSSGLQQRDFLHVDDVAGAFLAALASDWQGPFNIGSGDAVAVRDVISTLGRLSDRQDLIRLGVRQSPPNDPPILVADTTVLRERIGFTPRWSLDSGLADTWRHAQGRAPT